MPVSDTDTVFVVYDENTIFADVIQDESIQIDFIESEAYLISIVEETIEANLVEETIETNIVEETFIVEIDCFCGDAIQGSCGQIFATDVTPVSAQVKFKVYEPDTVPQNAVITEATTDDLHVVVHFVAEGGAYYSPTVYVAGIKCTNLQQFSNDRRLFYGSVTVPVEDTTNVEIKSSTGDIDYVLINQVGPGPSILSAQIGAYPGTQTAVKENDIVHITGTTDINAVSIRVLGYGAFKQGAWFPVTNGVFDITAVVSSGTGIFNGKLVAVNSFGTNGDEYITDNTIVLDQIVPSFIDLGTTYPNGQSAFKEQEQGIQKTEVHNFSSVVYSSPTGDFIIENTSTYELEKIIALTNPAYYNDSSTNFRIYAHRDINDTYAIFTKVIDVADIAPTVLITQPSTRLRSSPTGVVYTITATSDQKLNGGFQVNVPVSGVWQQASFTGGNKVFTNQILIRDTDQKGIADWDWGNTQPTNLAGIPAQISGRESVGGFVQRTLTIAAWPNREGDIGTVVTDVSKIRCENLSKGGTAPNGGTYFEYVGNLLDEENKFTITGPTEVLNNVGWLWYNKDINNAISNTSGTAQVIIEELV